MPNALFDGFEAHDVPTGAGATVHVRTAGDGPPVLLLHGYPESHLMWHAVAPRLVAAGFHVVAADLPGYGDSTAPPAADDHVPSSKRAVAAHLVATMAALGHERFAVLGHDRGGRVAYRMAIDAPGAVERVAALDVVPTGEVWARADATFALGYWHWSFLAQPAPLPESLILGDPDGFFERHVRAMGIGADAKRYPEEVLDAYRAGLRDPARVGAICEDYRAGASVDRGHDDADRAAGRTIDCPMLVLWGARGALERFYGDVLAVWRPWAPQVAGRAVDASHFLVEDRPEEVADELSAFLGAA